jgi:hypothetical protein
VKLKVEDLKERVIVELGFNSEEAGSSVDHSNVDEKPVIEDTTGRYIS